MSSLLREAIVDAKALKEAALKNAEASVIEKYSSEVKETLDKLLEQDDLDPALPGEMQMGTEPALDPMATAMEDPTMGAPEEEYEEIVSDEDVPLAASDDLPDADASKEGSKVEFDLSLDALQEAIGELQSLQQTMEEDQEIEISEKDLYEILSEDEEEGLGPVDTRMTRGAKLIRPDRPDPEEEEEGAFEDLPMEDPIEELADRLGISTSELAAAVEDAGLEVYPEGEGVMEPMSPDEEHEYRSLPDVRAPEYSDEDEEEPEESLEEASDYDALVDSILEKLTVDMGAELAGWAGRSSDDMRYQMEKEIAHRRSTDIEEDLETLKKAQEELVFENKQLKEQNEQYKQATNELKDSLQDVNLSNARLLYTNRVLRNASLNERQKERIVEAISRAGSVTEARMVFDTLQSTVEAKPKKSPQSLSEAITRRSSVIRASRQESVPSDPFNERMKRLAGIK